MNNLEKMKEASISDLKDLFSPYFSVILCAIKRNGGKTNGFLHRDCMRRLRKMYFQNKNLFKGTHDPHCKKRRLECWKGSSVMPLLQKEQKTAERRRLDIRLKRRFVPAFSFTILYLSY